MCGGRRRGGPLRPDFAAGGSQSGSELRPAADLVHAGRIRGDPAECLRAAVLGPAGRGLDHASIWASPSWAFR